MEWLQNKIKKKFVNQKLLGVMSNTCRFLKTDKLKMTLTLDIASINSPRSVSYLTPVASNLIPDSVYKLSEVIKVIKVMTLTLTLKALVIEQINNPW